MLAYPQARNASFKKHALAISLSFLFYPAAWAVPASNALPVLGNIASGTADVTRNISQGKLTVNQQTDKLIANWNSFNVGANAQVVFNQPSTNSIALNRIGSAAASQIFGQVTANGKLILVNPNGLTIGSTGQISASSVIASTLNISDSDFNTNNLTFERGAATRGIDNQGVIQSRYGSTILLASSIKNTGTLSAKPGRVILANGDRIAIVDNNGNNYATVLKQSSVASLIQTTGTIQAEGINNFGGTITITARPDTTTGGERTDIYSTIELAGTLSSNYSSIRGSHIYITGQLDNPNSLSLDAAGSIYVNAPVNLTNDDQSLNLGYSSQAGQGLFFGDNGKINLTGSGASFASKGYYYKVIHNIDELQAIGRNHLTLADNYVLGNDIDASATAGWNEGKGFLPIGGNRPHNGSISRFFSGQFNGLGHSVKQLTINRGSSDYIGLFGAAQNASISHVRLNDVSIVGDNYVGALVGYYQGTSGARRIQGNQVSGTVSGISNNQFKTGGIGGLIGYTDITSDMSSEVNLLINHNSSNARVSGYLYVGGLLGSSSSNIHGTLNIQDNQVAGNVWAYSLAGGLLAANQTTQNAKVNISNNIISTSINSTNALGEDYPGMFGGLIGRNIANGTTNGTNVTIKNNLFSGNLDAANLKSGGLIGSNTVFASNSMSLTGNQVTGNVTGATAVADSSSENYAKGGLIGFNNVSGTMNITDSLVSGNVSSTGDYTGGLIGYNTIRAGSLTIQKAHVSGQVNGNAYVGGLIGANRTGTTGSLLIGNTYTSDAVTASASHVGGLIGVNTTVANATSRIFNSYANGSISGSSETGGLIGYRNGVGNLRVDRSFWDLDNTGQPASIGGTGLSSEQMKQLSTYAGWSINTNPLKGSIWYINDGVSAPALR